MPLTDEQKALAFTTLVPGACAIGSTFICSPRSELMKWWEDLKKPSYYFSKEAEIPALTVAHLSSYLPLMYATYKIFKERGGFDHEDSKKALSCYLLLHGVAFSSAVAKNKRDLKGLFGSTGALFGISCLLTYFYHKVDQHAGRLTMPYTAVMGLFTMLTYHVWELNEKK